MIKRHIEKTLDLAIKHFPAVILTGPRQVGKTTLLLNKYLDKGYNYVSLDNIKDRLLAQNNPSSFLDLHKSPLIIDEAQKATELFEEIEYRINEAKRTNNNKNVNGLYILTGSSRRELLERAKESLAGRCAILNMSSLSLNEIYNRENVPFLVDINIINERLEKVNLSKDELFSLILKGGLPKIYDDKDLPLDIYYSSYLSTYLEKDVKDLVKLKDEQKFLDLITLLASLTGEELNYDGLSKKLGVSANTIKSWINVMNKTGLIYLLEPYNEFSFLKRVIKRPKIYFFDTGIICNLLGIDTLNTLYKSPFKGRIFETFVINEIRKTYINEGMTPKFYFYRDDAQKEIDLIILNDGKLYSIESKSGDGYSLNDVSSFKKLKSSVYEVGSGAIICSTNKISALSDNIYIIPASSI